MCNQISLEELLKQSKKYTIKKTLLDYLKNLLIVGISLYLCWEFFEFAKPFISKYLIIILCTCIVILIHPSYRYYQNTYSIFTIFYYIIDIEALNKAKSIPKLKSMSITYENYCDINKIKIDILKSISPIPLIVFFLGVALQGNVYQKLIIGIALLLVMLYIYWIRNTYESYKNNIFCLSQIKKSIVSLESK
ncbi:hypothetical protein [Bacillus cereus]|uniref:hypothetical protein n=1 Tax=Bacillus cereus TaxID=1396 RepID=UPI000B4BF12D|nr:hypothetical protein [Bacillus cereus]EKS8377537.1 hypothetical protein [Bacillus cereus]